MLHQAETTTLATTTTNADAASTTTTRMPMPSAVATGAAPTIEMLLALDSEQPVGVDCPGSDETVRDRHQPALQNQNQNHRFNLHEPMNDLVIFPIRNPGLWTMVKQAQHSMWVAEEVDLSQDYKDYHDKLNDSERTFLLHILGFFAGSDGIVLENLASRFCRELTFTEVRHFYYFQMAIESVHSETYSLLIDTYVHCPTKKLDILDSVKTNPAVALKAQWAMKWIGDSKSSIEMRLLAFAAVEGIFFSGSFCAIFWLKQRGLMPGLTYSNELISRDEGLHTMFAVELYKHAKHKLSKQTVHDLVQEAVTIEKKFIQDALRENLIGMNAGLMGQYIEYVADRLLEQLGYQRIWESSNPFDFMELCSLTGKTNFFEKRVGEYAKPSSIVNDVSNLFDDDF